MTAPRFELDGWSSRQAVSNAYQDNDKDEGADIITVRVETPGYYATEAEPACQIHIEIRGGPGSKRGAEPTEERIDMYVCDLDRLIAALTEAVRVARAEGVLEKYGE